MRQERFSTPGKVRLDISNPSGSVDVTTHDDKETLVELSMTRPNADESVLNETRVALVERDGVHEVTIEVKGPREGLGSLLRWLISIGGVNVSVRTPNGADLEVKTAAAGVTARGRYGNVAIKTASGSVRIDEALGKVNIKTASGEVDCGSLAEPATVNSASGKIRIGSSARELEARTASGRIDIDNAQSRLEARSASGAITVGTADGDVRVETVSGSARIDKLVSGRAELKTVSGSIVAGVAEGTSVHVDAKSVSGSLESELELDDAPDPAHAGGPTLSLAARSVSGSVRIVHAKARTAA